MIQQQDALQSTDTAKKIGFGQKLVQQPNEEQDDGVGPLDPDYEWNEEPDNSKQFEHQILHDEDDHQAEIKWAKDSLETEKLDQRSGRDNYPTSKQRGGGAQHYGQRDPKWMHSQQRQNQKRDQYGHDAAQGARWIGRGGRAQHYEDRYQRDQQDRYQGGNQPHNYPSYQEDNRYQFQNYKNQFSHHRDDNRQPDQDRNQNGVQKQKIVPRSSSKSPPRKYSRSGSGQGHPNDYHRGDVVVAPRDYPHYYEQPTGQEKEEQYRQNMRQRVGENLHEDHRQQHNFSDDYNRPQNYRQHSERHQYMNNYEQREEYYGRRQGERFETLAADHQENSRSRHPQIAPSSSRGDKEIIVSGLSHFDYQRSKRDGYQGNQMQQPPFQRQMSRDLGSSQPQQIRSNENFRNIRRSRSRSPPQHPYQNRSQEKEALHGLKSINQVGSQKAQPRNFQEEYFKRPNSNMILIRADEFENRVGNDERFQMQKNLPRELEIVLRSPTPDENLESEVLYKQRSMPLPALENRGQNQSNEVEPNSPPQSPTSHINCNVYIAGIPRRANEDTLRKVFSQYGSIQSVNVIKDHQTGNSRGFAYIRFSKIEEATNAIMEMDGKRAFNDWQIKVEHAKRGKPDEGSGKPFQRDFEPKEFQNRSGKGSEVYQESQMNHSNQNFSRQASRGINQSDEHLSQYQGNRQGYYRNDKSDYRGTNGSIQH